MTGEAYHDEVAAYYDAEAEDFEARAGQNHVLEQLRQAFRDVTMAYGPQRMLEVGYGPGLDMEWFADQPNIMTVHGLDVTPSFHRIVTGKSESRGDGKIHALLGSAEDAEQKMEGKEVDTVVVFFGALNTTADLAKAAESIANVLRPGGRAVLTFVNRWYAFDILWNVMTLRPRRAFARLRPVWGGYSPTRHLPSVCHSSRSVRKAFAPHLKRVRRQGFCITHPAWYRHHWAPEGSLRNRVLHAIDRALRFTPFWNLGEYSLYVYERPSAE
jgi:SAM-dependent methyltransferase